MNNTATKTPPAPPRASATPRALDPRYYTAAEMYERERERLLARAWQFAGHQSALQKAGDYFTCEIAGEPIFCLRGEDGGVRAFYNVCQHRAHQLVAAGAGNLRKMVVCPYHGWSYDFAGQLAGAPKGVDKSCVRLAEARLENFCGFLFVNLDADAAPMDEWFPKARAELREFVPNIDALAPLEWVEIPERCNWKVSVENHSECYHCPLNHLAFANGIIEPRSYDIQPQGRCLRHTTKCQNLEKMSYPVDLDANPRAGEYSTWFLWPLFAFQVYPGNVLNTYHWRPQGTDDVVVWRGWYTPGGGESEVIRDLAKQDRATTVEEDIRIVESVQRGLRSRGYRPGPLVIKKSGLNSEHSIAALHQWLREAVD